MLKLSLINSQAEISSSQEIETIEEHIIWLLKKTIRKNTEYYWTLQRQEGIVLHQKKLKGTKINALFNT